MRRKLVIGYILFVAGILMQEVSDITDIWIIGVFGGLLWPVGMVMVVNTSMSLKHEKQRNHSSHPPTEQNKN